MASRAVLGWATAALTGAFGAAVSVSSLENGIGWSSGGVEAGTFPFLVGLVLIGASVVNGIAAGRRREDHESLVDAGDARKLAGFFGPALAFVLTVPLLGMHVAAALYVFGTLAWNRTSLLRAALAAALVAVALYLLFDKLFQVSLPIGALGAALGF